MATINEQKTTAMKQAEKELLAALAPQDVIHPDLLHYMNQYRSACAHVIFCDVKYTQRQPVEQKLWDFHLTVNHRFKKLMRMYRKAQSAPEVVESRKIAKRYLTWIKDSQRFYRCFIQTLTELHGGIPELNALVSNQKLTISSEENIEHEVIRLSAHSTLIRLGDLSRYREIQFGGKTPNWGPAVGYYDLAGAIYPASGTSHHQLAVVAQHSGSHLRATYHLYRSLAVEEPHPRARENLEQEFQKITAALEKGELDAFDGQGPERAMIPQFLLLHARSHKVEDLSRHDDFEHEVLGQLAHSLTKRFTESTLSKIVLINIAAQYDAGIRFQDAAQRQKETHDFENMYAFLSLLRLNIRTFSLLLDILRAELEASSREVSPPRYGSKTAQRSRTARLTVIERRILPICRHYSSWLLSNFELVLAEMRNPELEKDITGFFRIYAKTLTILASDFDAETLPMIEYLLEEDEDTIAFKAFDQEKTLRRYYDPSSRTLKPNFHVQGIARNHPSVEMLGRIRDLLTDGVELTIKDGVPIDLVDGSAFVFQEQVDTSMPAALPNDQQPPVAAINAGNHPNLVGTGTGQFNALAYLEDVISRHSSSRSSSVTRNPAMENMVDDLVGSESSHIVPTKSASNGSNGLPRLSTHGITHTPPPEPYIDYGPIGTPPKTRKSSDFGAIGTPPKANGNETSYDVIGTPTAQELARNLSNRSSLMEASPRPRLPSIYNSPFAPQPNPQPSPQQISQSNNYHVTGSSMSSLAEPSSIGFHQGQVRGRTTHSPRNQPSIWNDNRGGGAVTNSVRGANYSFGPRPTFDDSNFISSNILSGSTWTAGSRQTAMMQTPPNGQGVE